MEREHKGCLTGIAMMTIGVVVMVIADHLDCNVPFFKYCGYVYFGFVGAYIGPTFFGSEKDREKNQYSKKKWIWMCIAGLITAALMAWCLEGRLW